MSDLRRAIGRLFEMRKRKRTISWRTIGVACALIHLMEIKGTCSPSRRIIADLTQIHLRDVSRALNRLECI